jgi:hypothetical protein
MYLHLMQLSVTTNAMTYPSLTRLIKNPILPQPRNPLAAPSVLAAPFTGSIGFSIR